jgi:hypothetical protein
MMGKPLLGLRELFIEPVQGRNQKVGVPSPAWLSDQPS